MSVEYLLDQDIEGLIKIQKGDKSLILSTLLSDKVYHKKSTQITKQFILE